MPRLGKWCVVCSCLCGLSRLQIRSSLLPALGDHVEGNALTFVDAGHPGFLNGAGVHEHVLRTVRRRDEAIALRNVEKLNSTCSHRGLLEFAMQQRRTNATICVSGTTADFWVCLGGRLERARLAKNWLLQSL